MADSLDPAGKIHLPIGIVNTLDRLKTFVEARENHLGPVMRQNEFLVPTGTPEVKIDFGAS
jgi:hypothetical protein